MGSTENCIREVCTNGYDEIMRTNHYKNRKTIKKKYWFFVMNNGRLTFIKWVNVLYKGVGNDF